MAVPAAASGRTKGSGRFAGAGLGSRRSPERGAGASRKSRSSPRSRHLRRLSRRGSSRPALSPPPLPPHAWDAEASAGPLGLFRNELGSRRTGARLRLPPALAEPHQTLGSAGRREGLPCPPRGSPPSGTPSADPENKARRSAQVGERDPRDRLLPEEIRLPPANRGPALGYFRCSSAPPPRAGEELGLTLSSLEPRNSACGPERLARLCAPPGYLQAALPVICMSGLRSPTLSKLLFFFIATPTGPRRPPAAPHKRTGRRLCFWFIAPQQAAGVRAQAGAARLSQRVSTVYAGVPFAPSRETRNRECLEVQERSAPGPGGFG